MLVSEGLPSDDTRIPDKRYQDPQHYLIVLLASYGSFEAGARSFRMILKWRWDPILRGIWDMFQFREYGEVWLYPA